MTKSTKLDENLEGVENIRAWKYHIMLILEENDLEIFIKEEVLETEEVEVKAKYKKDMIKDKRIIYDSIKDNLIHQVSSRRTPKEMFDALSILFEGRNINRKTTLRNHLKGVKAQSQKPCNHISQEYLKSKRIWKLLVIWLKKQKLQ